MAFELRARAEQVLERCQALARLSEDSSGVRRTFLSAPMRECHRGIAQWLKPLGVTPTLDAVGNIRALYPGATPDAPRLLVGSHLDTVPNAGAYDGILGVVLAVALLELLEGRALPFAIELVGFSEEEGVRFGFPFIGSLALVGRLDDSHLEKRDSLGISVRKAIEDFGLNSADLSLAALHPNTFAFLEFHIEQGPVLENLNLSLAVVEAIVGQSRLEFRFFGRSNHAGTTPMHLRHDALAAAAEWIVAVESESKRVPGLVATCGAIHAVPGAVNVIPGEVRVSLDIRHPSNAIRAQALSSLQHSASEISSRRGVSVSQATLLEQPAVLMDQSFCDQIDQSIRASGVAPHRMTSGAGHDAMILAEKVPSAMIFLRSPGGISHDPAESVLLSDVEAALAAGLQLIEDLSSSVRFSGHNSPGQHPQTRTLRA